MMRPPKALVATPKVPFGEVTVSVCVAGSTTVVPTA